ncbi:unnamed protein product [Caenorhabditis brenneri]
MSDTLSSVAEKLMEQTNNNLSGAMGQLSVNSDKTPTPPKNLSDMPIYVVVLIIERSDYKEQLILRKVSKSLRELVDKQKPALTSLNVFFDFHYIECFYNTDKQIYSVPHIGADNYWFGKKSKRVIMSDDYEKIAFDDLASSLKNPKLQLNSFSAEFRYHLRDLYAKFGGFLESIGHQVSVRSCKIEINVPGEYCPILPYLKPKVLEKITVLYRSQRDSSGVDPAWETVKRIALLDQWKQAEELELVYGCEVFPMKYAKHFKRFRFNEYKVDDRLLIRIRNYLSKLNNFELCSISAEWPVDAQHLRRVVGDPAAPNERTKYVSHYSIPNSDDYLEFTFFEFSIEIRKIKRS